jgi:hypothetical protein
MEYLRGDEGTGTPVFFDSGAAALPEEEPPLLPQAKKPAAIKRLSTTTIILFIQFSSYKETNLINYSASAE